VTIEVALKSAVVVGKLLEVVTLDSDVTARTDDSVDVAVGTVDTASLDATVLPVAEDTSVSTVACVLVWVALGAVSLVEL
jgi:hypothetical protein